MKAGMVMGAIVLALLVGFYFVKDDAPSGKIQDNFGKNWAR
jgi:hypothetical protein